MPGSYLPTRQEAQFLASAGSDMYLRPCITQNAVNISVDEHHVTHSSFSWESDRLTTYLGRGESTQIRRVGSTPRTWAATFAAIEVESKLAANLMRLWALLHEKDLWYDLLCPADLESGITPDWLCALATDEAMFHAAVRVLIRFSVVYERAPDSYSLHPATQKWVLDLMKTVEKREFKILAVVVVGFSIPDDTVHEFRQMRKRLLPHASKCMVFAKELSDLSVTDSNFYLWKPLSGLGELFVDAGRLDIAEQIYKLALGCAEHNGRELNASSTMQCLGDIYMQNIRLNEAESAYEQAVGLYNRARFIDHSLYLTIAANHGKLYFMRGQLEDAQVIFEEALGLGIKSLGFEHPSTLNVANCLGGFYAQIGVLVVAENLLMKALKGLNKAYGARNVHTLNAVNNVGMLYAKQGRIKEAEAMYRHAVEGYEKTCGPSHLNALETANNLGNLLKRVGRFTEAEHIYQDVILGCRQMEDSARNLLFSAYNNLGTLYCLQRREKDAEKMFILALKGKSRTLGPRHTSTLRTADNLSTVYIEQSRVSRAHHLLHRASKHREYIIGHVPETPTSSEGNKKAGRLSLLFRSAKGFATNVEPQIANPQKWSERCRVSLHNLKRHTLHFGSPLNRRFQSLSAQDPRTTTTTAGVISYSYGVCEGGDFH